MAAEALADELELPLYRIDLSQVVNKYIGETEKNLRRLFDAADAADVILFFDEADALFGKRTEVKDAHDRYANLEISYLLERMERFKGLAILATNRKKDLDEAFLRRLRFVVEFPLPGVGRAPAHLARRHSRRRRCQRARSSISSRSASRWPAGTSARSCSTPACRARPKARRARSTMPARDPRGAARVRQARSRQQPRPVRPLCAAGRGGEGRHDERRLRRSTARPRPARHLAGDRRGRRRGCSARRWRGRWPAARLTATSAASIDAGRIAHRRAARLARALARRIAAAHRRTRPAEG